MPDNEPVNKPNPPLVYHTSVRSLIRPLVMVVALVWILRFVTSQLISSETPDASLSTGAEEIWGIFWAMILLLTIVWMIRPLMLLFDSRFEVTANHVRTCIGRLSLRREEIHIPFEEIKGVRARQSILERILGIGDVLIWTGFNQTPDVIFRKVSGPSAIATTISDRVDRAILGMKNRPASSHQQSG